MCVGDALKNDYEPLWEEEQMLTEAMRTLRKALEEQSGEKELKKLEKEYKRLISRKDMLIEKLLGGVIGDLDYEKHSADLEDRCRQIESKIAGIKQSHLQYNNYEARMEDIKAVIRSESLIKKAGTKALLSQIHQIEVHKDGRLLISFEPEGKYRKEAVYNGK